LGALVVTICANYGLAWAVVRLLRRGRGVLVVLGVVGYSMTWLVSAGIVLLGPAALILMKPTS